VLATYVIVSGPPGSGKSTLAVELASRPHLPLFMKDTVKEALADVLGSPDLDASRRLGHAAVHTLVSLGIANGRGVLESNWRASTSLDELRRLDGPVVEVFCDCDPAVSRRRYERRAPGRHAIHFDTARIVDDGRWSGDALHPVAGGWPVVRVDTSQPVDVGRLCEEIREAA
jgi:predicted kinase